MVSEFHNDQGYIYRPVTSEEVNWSCDPIRHAQKKDLNGTFAICFCINTSEKQPPENTKTFEPYLRGLLYKLRRFNDQFFIGIIRSCAILVVKETWRKNKFTSSRI